MEGVSAEASSLAGHLKLGRLITLYDGGERYLVNTMDFPFKAR